jgi:hypothetical protein
MKKRNTPREDISPEDRKRKLNFKRKRERNQEPPFNHRRVRGLEDLEDYE